MENRFGFKDFFLTGLLVALIVMIALAMVQFDRQWEQVRAIREAQKKQGETLVELSRQMQAIAGRPAGVAVEGAAGAGTSAKGGAAILAEAPASGFDPFHALRGIYKEPDFAYGGQYTGGLPVQLKKLTPFVPSDLYQRMAEGMVLEPLLQRNAETQAWEPFIAEKWEASKDGLTITFDLRKGVTFSDGHPLTAEDVEYTFAKILSPDTDCPDYKALFDKIVSVKAEGTHRVVFRFSEPYFKSLEAAGGMGILAKHWYSKFSAAEFNRMPGLLFGSGPMQMEMDQRDWKPGDGVAFVRNPWYWGPKAPLDRVVLREYQNSTAREVDFRNGIIDFLGVSPDKYPEIKQEMEETAKGRDPNGIGQRAVLRRYTSLDDGYAFIGWNQEWGGKPSPFADKRVRQAMTMLLDRERARTDIFNGIGQVSTGPFELASQQSDPAIKPLPYDPARALALLKEAGWEDRDDNGILEDKTGREFRFKLSYPGANAGVVRQMQFFRDGLRRHGILMDADPLDFPVLLGKLSSRDFQAVSLAWGGSVESDPRQIFHSVAIKGGDNNVGYSNPKLDKLIDKARVEMDVDKRNAMWKECHRIIAEDQPYTFLFTREAIVLVNKRFKGVTDPKVGFYNYPYFYVPKAAESR